MMLRDALLLGRVSNLPTVWTNSLVGIVLAGVPVAWPATPLVMLVLSLFYVGGMYLNDAFDAAIDAVERPERPIPAGRVGRGTVFVIGFALLGLGIAGLACVAAVYGTGAVLVPVLSGLALAGVIVLYDWYHKSNPLSPFVMGLARVLVYFSVGFCFVGSLPTDLLVAGLFLLSYLIGLTYVAKQENIGRVANMWPLLFLAAPVAFGAVLAAGNIMVLPFLAVFVAWMLVALFLVRRRGPGDIPRAVVSLIAGISLFDAMAVASPGGLMVAGLAVVGFLATLALQRLVPGT